MKKMMIAIVNKPDSFAKYWISYCENHDIRYKVVNPYSSDIIRLVEGCDAFMWHFSHVSHKDMFSARRIIFSLEAIGVKCFPDSRTCWHFDDKIAQKYLLESLDAPLVPSYVFYDRKDALSWAGSTTFPKVFKLKNGAGSSNVRLVRSLSEAESLIDKCFSEGFRQYRWREQFRENFLKYRHNIVSLREALRPLKKAFMRYPTDFDHYCQREIGYAYFQDFIPNNVCDVRIVVIGDKAFSLKRMVRSGDFRASGSGVIVYDTDSVDQQCASLAFTVNERLRMQCVAFDFVVDGDGNPLIVEISYGFSAEAYFRCKGYWTSDMLWHEGTDFDFCGWMVEQVLK